MVLALAGLVCVLCRRAGDHGRWLALAGVFGGLAWGCKYTGALAPVGLAAVALLDAGSGRLEVGRRVGRAAVVGLTALAVFAPWLAKNWLFTGSPVYPLLWPAADMDAARQWFYSRPDLAERGAGALLVFWRAAFLGVQGGNHYDMTLGPLLVLLPLGVLPGWRWLPPSVRAALRPLLVFALAGYAVWVALTYVSSLATQARLFAPVLAALALLAAGGLRALQALDTPALRVSWVVQAVAVVVLAVSGIESLSYFVSQNPLPYLAGGQPAADYRAARLGWYPLAFQAVGTLPAGTRVMQLWEARSLDCPAHVRCVPDVVIDRWWHLRRTLGEPAGILARWRAEGVTHVLLYEAGANFAAMDPRSPLAPGDWAALAELRQQMTLVTAIGPAYGLYALR
jgi:hypothetical protein